MAWTLARRYRLTGPIADGPTGRLWQGVDLGTDQPVAVKILHPRLAADQRIADQLQVARRTLSALWHPGIVRLLDVVVDGGEVGLVTELAPGTDLARLLAGTGPLPPSWAARLAAGIADALDAVHRAGLVHGDLKPTNVIVTDSVIVTDAGGPGLAPAGGRAGPPVRLTDTSISTLLGVTDAGPHPSPYRAPWAIGGAVPTASGDVHALGVLLREMLTGDPGRDPVGSDPRLQEVIDACVRGEPSTRPSAGAVASWLRHLTAELEPGPPEGAGHPLRAAATAGPATRPRPARRRVLPWLVGGAAIGAVAVVTGVIVGAGPGAPQPVGESTSPPATTAAPVAAPQLPPEAAAHTEEGGTAFLQYWFTALSFAAQTGDLDPVTEATSPDCQDCQEAIARIEATHAAGGSFRGGAYVVRGVTAASLWSEDQPVYDATIDRTHRVELDASGATVATLPALSFATCTVVLEWSDEQWRVREVISPGCVG